MWIRINHAEDVSHQNHLNHLAFNYIVVLIGDSCISVSLCPDFREDGWSVVHDGLGE